MSEENQGLLLRHVVPADNSCLFSSIGFCLEDTATDTNYLRQLIAATVASDTEKYNEAFLGQSNSSYCQWINTPDAWGGGIEVDILSQFYHVEITVVNIQSLSISRFGEDKNYTHRILLLYDGIHYDPLFCEYFNVPQQQKLFSTSDSQILQQALELAREAKLTHQFTDLKNFNLRCNVCNALLKGESDAQRHAKETLHVNFSEIK